MAKRTQLFGPVDSGGPVAILRGLYGPADAGGMTAVVTGFGGGKGRVCPKGTWALLPNKGDVLGCYKTKTKALASLKRRKKAGTLRPGLATIWVIKF